jgi:hypothetical protein
VYGSLNASEPDDDLLLALLEVCEEFFATTSQDVHRELDALLNARDITGGVGWLIDMLALNRQRLQTPTDTG